MYQTTIAFYGTKAALEGALLGLSKTERYTLVGKLNELPITLHRKVLPIGVIPLELAIGTISQDGAKAKQVLEVQAVKKGVRPAFLMYRYLYQLEEDLLAANGEEDGTGASNFNEIYAAVQRQQTITGEQVTQLRRTLAPGLEENDVDFLFQLDSLLTKEKPTFWLDAFVDLLLKYYAAYPESIVDETGTLHLTEAAEQDLLARIREDDKVSEATELQLLNRITQRFDSTSEVFQQTVLDEIYESVMNSTDQNFIDQHRVQDSVDQEDMVLLRRAIFGAGGDGGIGVSRREADLLFKIDLETAKSQVAAAEKASREDAAAVPVVGAMRLNTITSVPENHPDWAPFFASAIASHLLDYGRIPNQIDVDEKAWLMAILSQYDGPTPALQALGKTLKEKGAVVPGKVKALLG